jgi:uncharacterized protein (TIGR00288 family)
MEKEQNIALLIDCDNVSYQAIDGVLNELANHGVVNIRRAYGDWTRSELRGWEGVLQRCAIRPVQQFAYTKGKNSTDSAMIIDAMDLLYGKDLDGIALMTSDSDFTSLVMRFKDSGLRVYGFGAKKTPESLVNACSRFIFTEKLAESTSDPSDGDKDGKEREKKMTRRQLRQDSGLVRLLRTAVEEKADEDGWSNFSQVNHYINNNTSFSSINYGYKRLSDLLRVSDLFEIEMRNNNSAIYVKEKK